MRETRQLKVALIGFGKMGSNHFDIINRFPYAKIVGICEPNSELLKNNNISQSRISIYSKLDDLLNEQKPHIVHIVTPPETHYVLAKQCIECGANVYIEKPICLEENESRELIRLAEQNGLKVCPGHQLIYTSTFSELVSKLKLIDKPTIIESYFTFKKVRKNIDNTDQIFDILPHPTYLLVQILNELKINKIDELKIDKIISNRDGGLLAILNINDIVCILNISLRSRPIESYIKIISNNGTIYSDFIRGGVYSLIGPGTSIFSVLLNPYLMAWQIITSTTLSLIKKIYRKDTGYSGLVELIESFYNNIIYQRKKPPIQYDTINKTVQLCSIIYDELNVVKEIEDKKDYDIFNKKSLNQKSIDKTKNKLIVTGGTGFLGNKIVTDLRNKGYLVKVLSRNVPDIRHQLPGVVYEKCDLSKEININSIIDYDIIVHCAAETSGGKEDQIKNSVEATSNIIKAADIAGINRVLHISSIAVLNSKEKTYNIIDEKTPLIKDDTKGPYAWGKAESERVAEKLSIKYNIQLRIIRLAPLIDYNEYSPPGRLGREIGPIYVAVCPKKGKLPLCSLDSVSMVIEYYIKQYDSTPSVLNLIEKSSPNRKELVHMLKDKRKDLKILWLPMSLLSIMSILIRSILTIIFPNKDALDIKKAFTDEKYDLTKANNILEAAEKKRN